MKTKHSHKNSYYNDIALKLGHQLFGVNYLHYGYFEDKKNVSLSTLHEAQEVYVQKLLSNIPSDVKIILDVGCGTGGIAKQLIEKGYTVICVAPDSYLIEKTIENTNNKAKTYIDLYENLTDIQPESIDLILMSESAQYIKPDPGWLQNQKLLKKGGYLLVCDFFKIREVDDPNMSRSGQPFDNFMNRAKAANFAVLKQEDITSFVAPTMDLTQNFISEKVFPVAEALFEFIRRRYPIVYKIGKKLLLKKILKVKTKYSYLGSDKFVYYKKYMTLLFQKN